MGYSSWGRKESDTTQQLHFGGQQSMLWEPLVPGTCRKESDPQVGLSTVRWDGGRDFAGL